MKAKYVLGLLLPIILAAGTALAQQPAPPAPPADVEPLENFSFLVDGSGFLGVYAENINRENMGRYRMSQVRGVGVTQVVKDSPAEKAGLRKDDVILRIDGENVNSVRKLNRLVSEMAPDHSVRIAVSRGGAEQEVTATIGKRTNSSMVFGGPSRLWKWEGNDPRTWKWEGPLFNKKDLLENDGDLTFVLGNSRRIGVSTMALTKQLADYFGITGGQGLLVTSVTENSPAANAGVRAGDVITAVDGEAVDSSGDLSRVINRKKEGDVTLTIIRNRAQQTIRVTPKEGGGFSGTITTPEIGRRIVIPRIEIPFPSIEINLPRVRVTPRVRIIRTGQGPI
ncbi:MAG TPA: PDZ domain-containing protein [Pyrinomonadaceae bacterium]|nr:PDZ domain-containing protein [Pyrinomonadaceae bacterium]